MAFPRYRVVPFVVASLLACAAVGLPDPRSLRLPEAQASVSTQLPFEHLARASTRVVLGTAVESRSMWEDDASGARRIVTYHRVRVERQVTDDGTGEVWVRCLGGTVDGIGQRVEGEAALRTGLRALLFLTARQDGTFAVLGLAQGMYPVQKGADGVERLAGPRFPGVVLQDRKIVAAITVLPGKTVDDAVALIRAARASHAQ